MVSIENRDPRSTASRAAMDPGPGLACDFPRRRPRDSSPRSAGNSKPSGRDGRLHGDTQNREASTSVASIQCGHRAEAKGPKGGERKTIAVRAVRCLLWAFLGQDAGTPPPAGRRLVQGGRRLVRPEAGRGRGGGVLAQPTPRRSAPSPADGHRPTSPRTPSRPPGPSRPRGPEAISCVLVPGTHGHANANAERPMVSLRPLRLFLRRIPRCVTLNRCEPLGRDFVPPVCREHAGRGRRLLIPAADSRRSCRATRLAIFFFSGGARPGFMADRRASGPRGSRFD